MVYIIVHWNEDELRYDIVHYTHNFDDMERIWGAVSAMYPKARLLVDIRAIEVHEQRLQFNAMKQRIKNAKNKNS